MEYFDTSKLRRARNTNYALWSLLTVIPIFLPTLQRGGCPYRSVVGTHIHWNHRPKWTGIRKASHIN
jgi:hypothetical protein